MGIGIGRIGRTEWIERIERRALETRAPFQHGRSHRGCVSTQSQNRESEAGFENRVSTTQLLEKKQIAR